MSLELVVQLHMVDTYRFEISSCKKWVTFFFSDGNYPVSVERIRRANLSEDLCYFFLFVSNLSERREMQKSLLVCRDMLLDMGIIRDV